MYRLVATFHVGRDLMPCSDRDSIRLHWGRMIMPIPFMVARFPPVNYRLVTTEVRYTIKWVFTVLCTDILLQFIVLFILCICM